MSLSIGIVGLPNVGKSTLFNALGSSKAEASNYPFCTIDPNVGTVKVPDERLAKLAEISKSKKILPTTIEFVDIAGLVKGAHQGEGLGNKFLANIRECDAICMVIRDFEDPNIIHVHGKIDPQDDRETIELELIMADLATVEKSLDKAKRDARSGNKQIAELRDVLEKIFVQLKDGKPARLAGLSDDEKLIIKSFGLISLKPIIYVVNTHDPDNCHLDIPGALVLPLNIKQEEEISNMEEAERREYIEELGLKESGLEKLIRTSYEVLGLLTFLTTGPEESRAWTVRNGAKAPQAAAVIHTDFEKGFIRAEIVAYDDFVRLGGEAGARNAGLLRAEGKDYVVKDGDVCHFLISN